MDDRRFIELYALNLLLIGPEHVFPVLDRHGVAASDFEDANISLAVEEARKMYDEHGNIDVPALGNEILKQATLDRLWPLNTLSILLPLPPKPLPISEIESMAMMLKRGKKREAEADNGG